jgi:hypothetical protein
MPRKYRFLAPKGCGPKLEKLLSDPPMLKAAFLAELDKTESAARAVCRRTSLIRSAPWPRLRASLCSTASPLKTS